MQEGRERLTVVVLCLGLLAVFVTLSVWGFVDGDEGFYLLASRLVMEGNVLYRGFFYPQMPLLPYVYGLWMKLFGTSWYAARLLSALLAAALGLLLYFHVRRTTGRRSLGLLAALLFAFSGLVTNWYTTAKTYSLSTFLLFSAYMLVDREPGSRWTHMLGGALLGLAVGVRLTFAAVLPAFVLCILRKEQPGGQRFARLAWLGTGFAAGLVPSIIFFLAGPDQFMFNNFTYHTIRSGFDLSTNITQRAETILELFAINDTDGTVSIQFFLLIVFVAAFAAARLFAHRRLPLALYVAALLLLISALPSPSYSQYFSVVVPFMVVSVAVYIGDSIRHESEGLAQRLKQGLGPLLLLGGVAYFAVWPFEFYRRCSWARSIPRVINCTGYRNSAIGTIQRVTAVMDRHARGVGDSVLTWWPGYFVGARSRPLKGMENHFGLPVSSRVTDRKRELYRLMSGEQVETAIQHHATHVIVLGSWAWLRDRYRVLARQSDYVLVDTIADVEIYLHTEPGRSLVRFAEELAADRTVKVRTVLWPEDYAEEEGAGLVAELGERMLLYPELHRWLGATPQNLGAVLPALAFWVNDPRTEHTPPFSYLNDWEHSVAGPYRLTLLRHDQASLAGVYLIERSDAVRQ